MRSSATSGGSTVYSGWSQSSEGTPQAAAPSAAVWSATLTPKDYGTLLGIGCANNVVTVADRCISTTKLSEDQFTFGSATFNVEQILVHSGSLILELNDSISDTLKTYNFCVGTSSFALSSATLSNIGTRVNSRATWTNAGLTWTEGTAVSLSIASSCAGTTPPAQSTDATLSGLTATSSDSASGTFSALTLTPVFAAATTSYSASVANSITHVKLTPTVNHAGASVEVGKQGQTLTAVGSGSASAAIALDEGANPITVKVTAQDGTSTATYTVTVTRAASTTPPAGAALVSNLGQTEGSNPNFSGNVATQGFTTGSNAGGYTLTSIEMKLTVTGTLTSGERATIRAQLWSDSSGKPGTKTVDLTVPSSVTAGAVAFAAPAGTTLSASTTYHLVVYTTGSLSKLGWRSTPSNAEDSGAATGWSIANFSYYQANRNVPDSGASWTANSSIPQIRVNGAAVSGSGQQQGPDGRLGIPLTAAFEDVPAEHDGETAFALLVGFSDVLGDGAAPPTASSFAVTGGKVKRVKQVGAGLWRVRIEPRSWREVAVTLSGGRDCGEDGAVCAADGRALFNTASVTVGGPVRIRVEGGRAREGRDERLDFTVSLNRAARDGVSVDYATADGTATAGEDYTAVSGTLVFPPGVTEQTIPVAILDDAIDEGRETFFLRLSNPQGAYLRNIHREAKGVIVNDDPLQKMWLSRFGRTVGSQVTDAVSDRLGGLAPGAHATLAGQALDLSRADDEQALAEALTGLARTFGAPGAPAANDDDPFARLGLGGGPDEPAEVSAPARSVTGRELLLGSSFHLATEGGGAGPALAAWGRTALGRFDGEEAAGDGRLRIDGEVLTGVLGADADWGRLLAGVAVSLSEGDGTFDNPGVDSGTVESTMTTVSPYLRLKVTERVSAWGLAGWGTGAMTIVQDARTSPARAGKETKTDLSMRLGALGARGALLEPDGAEGFDLALKADAFFVRTEWEKVSDETDTAADASRVRLVLDGGRAFTAGGGATFRPSLEVGLRYDGGDAETGTGVEVGGGVAYADASSGLSIEAKARMLVAHADSNYEEWGASASVRLDPGADGRGLSLSLVPTIGASSSAAERLWGAQDARALAPGGDFEAARGLQGEMGYGLALPGGRFTGTPNLGFGMSDGGARDYRIGWRLAPALEGDPGFEMSLDAARREPANDDAEHGVMLRGLMRW